MPLLKETESECEKDVRRKMGRNERSDHKRMVSEVINGESDNLQGRPRNGVRGWLRTGE